MFVYFQPSFRDRERPREGEGEGGGEGKGRGGGGWLAGHPDKPISLTPLCGEFKTGFGKPKPSLRISLVTTEIQL